MVSGHVDGVATLVSRRDFDAMAHFEIEAPKDLAKFIAEKGSVALDGTSLTVNKVGNPLHHPAHSAHAGRDDLGRAQGGRQDQYRSGHNGPLRRPAGEAAAE